MNVLTAQDFLEMVAVLEKYNTYDGEHYYLVPFVDDTVDEQDNVEESCHSD